MCSYYTALFLSSFVLAVLSLYWGVLFNVEQNLNSLVVHVVDFDNDPNPLVGPMIVQATEAQVRLNNVPHLGYVTMDPARYNNDPIAVRQSIYDFEAWAAVIINANATSMLRSAVRVGNSSYDPLGACQIVYVEARDQDSYALYIMPQLQALQTQMTSMIGRAWTQQVLANPNVMRNNLQRAPQALSPAIGFSVYNLRPFGPTQAVPAVTIGLIYLIIVSFFSFTFYLPVYTAFITPKSHPPLKFPQFIIMRILATLAAYMVISLAYSLVSLGFQIPFSHDPAPTTEVTNNPNSYGRGTFVVYWMINWVGMTALGLASENVAMVIGQPWTALWLIFWVITNVSTSFYPEELSPAFYNWGYAWPLHSVVEASRSTIFDLHSRIGLDFGILFAWAAVNIAVFPFACIVMAKKQKKEKEKGGE
jgi:hypothetical protein